MTALFSLSNVAFAHDNWQGPDGMIWKNGTNELCWRNGVWTPATAAPECDGALKPAPKAEAPAPAPVAEAPAPAPAPKPVPAVEKITYQSDALFDFDKAVLKPEAKTKLADLAAKAKEIKLEVVIAIGHTDSVGTDAYNQKLSERRANAVKDYLVSQGIEPSRIYTEGKGESQPVADNKSSAGRAKNRRVEIEVVGAK